MGVISFIPLFNWLVCSLASWRIFYFAVDTCFVSPTSFHALPSSIWSLFPYLLVYQFGILCSFRMPIEELWVNSSTLISFGCAGGRPGYLLGLIQANNGIWSMP
jgi:hypothetical protein